MKLSKQFFLSVLLILSYQNQALALKGDTDQPVLIDSNTANYDSEKGISVYTGNVVTVQGSLHINSDKLTVYVKDGEVHKMVFTGKPTKFRQRPSKGKDEIFGEGLTGEFYPKKSRLILIEEAMVSQGNNRSASRLIIYDSESSIIKAGEHSSDQKRVHSVFNPKKEKK